MHGPPVCYVYYKCASHRVTASPSEAAALSYIHQIKRNSKGGTFYVIALSTRNFSICLLFSEKYDSYISMYAQFLRLLEFSLRVPTSLSLGKAVEKYIRLRLDMSPQLATLSGGGEGRVARWAATAGRGTRKEGRGWGKAREAGLGE